MDHETIIKFCDLYKDVGIKEIYLFSIKDNEVVLYNRIIKFIEYCIQNDKKAEKLYLQCLEMDRNNKINQILE